MNQLNSTRATVLILSVLVVAPLTAMADVHLEWRSGPGMIKAGDTVDVGLYAVSDDENVQAFAGADVIFSWDPGVLEFQGIVNNGPYAWLGSYIPQNDPFGLNEQPTPVDGDGLYLAMRNFGTLPYATPSGMLITTFRFVAVGTACDSYVDILDVAGSPDTTETIVWSAIYPGLPATGELRNFELAGVGSAASEDCDANGCPDECQRDGDRDTVIDACDNCPTVPNRRQIDTDKDGVGDACRRTLPPATPQTPATGSLTSGRGATRAFERTMTGEGCGSGAAAATAMTMAVGLSCVPLSRRRMKRRTRRS